MDADPWTAWSTIVLFSFLYTVLGAYIVARRWRE